MVAEKSTKSNPLKLNNRHLHFQVLWSHSLLGESLPFSADFGWCHPRSLGLPPPFLSFQISLKTPLPITKTPFFKLSTAFYFIKANKLTPSWLNLSSSRLHPGELDGYNRICPFYIASLKQKRHFSLIRILASWWSMWLKLRSNFVFNLLIINEKSLKILTV